MIVITFKQIKKLLEKLNIKTVKIPGQFGKKMK